MKRELTCISCPIGCLLTVEEDEAGTLRVHGNACKRGEVYGIKEVTAPMRTVTSTVRVLNGAKPLASVRTQTDIPKDKIFDCMTAIKGVRRKAPISAGDIMIENVAGTGVNVIATSTVTEKH